MKKIILLSLLLLPFVGFSQLNTNQVIKSTNAAPYNTLQNALNYLRDNNGISASVTLLLDNDQNVSAPITIDAIPGTNTYTLTIKPNVGKTIRIVGDNVSASNGMPATIKFNSAKNIVIDGSNSANGNSRDLSIERNNVIDYIHAAAIWMASSNSTANNNITIKNTVIKFSTRNQQAKWLSGIYVGNSTGVNSNVAFTTSSSANSNLNFNNNEFTNVREGIYINSSTTEARKDNAINIENNVFGSTSSSTAPTQGIYILNSKNVTISDNNFSGLANNDTSTQKFLNAVLLTGVNTFIIDKNTINNLKINHSGNTSNAGIAVNGASSNGIISKNSISDIRRSSGGAISGLLLESSSTTNNIQVSNNIIYNISTAGENNNTSGAYGINIKSGGGYNIYFNTVVMNSQETINASNAALYLAGGNGIDIKNNIFYNTNATAGRRYAIYSNIASSNFSSDYNDLFSQDYIGYISSNRTSLANWRTGANEDANSKNIAPVFLNSNLRLNTDNSDNLQLIGQQVSPAITTDRFDITRNTPTIGSEEIRTCVPLGDPNVFGTNNWIGYVYNNAADITNPPAAPFASANYKGFVTENELFDRDSDTGNFSGATTQLCGDYNDHFAVRYKMRKNFPAGTYVFKVGGDDGYRLKVGTSTVIDNFNVHAYATSTSDPILLSGDTELILDYYEDMTHSRVSFSYTYTPCATLAAPTAIVRSAATACTTGDSVLLTAQGGTIAGTTYQWGTGTVIGTDIIAGQTGESITVSPTTATTYWVRRYSNDACDNYSTGVTRRITPTDRTAYGDGQWIGYVYSGYTSRVTPPAAPNGANYRGYVTEPAIFNRNVGDGVFRGATTSLCSAPSENFYVSYKMKLNLVAGQYNFTVGGDDGYRLYIDGVAQAGIYNWTEHGYTTSSISVNFETTGDHLFELQYFDGPGTSQVSFTYNKREGDPTVFGDGVWNVYGYNVEDINVDPLAASYYGWFIDPSLGINSEDRWNKDFSPSLAVATATAGTTAWAGSTLPNNNYTVIHKRKGFPCGLYQIKMDKWDDAVQVYLNGNLIFEATGYNGNANTIVHPELPGYYLNADSKMEVRLREGGGDAYVKMTLSDKPSVFNGTWNANPENTSIRIDSDLVLNNNLNVCSCTVKAGKKLTIEANAALNVMNNVVVETAGNILVKNTGSLVQIKDDATFTGDINSFTMERNTTSMIIYDYTYWSSPVAAQKLVTFSPLTLADKYYSYNGTAWFIENRDNNMTAGRGYIIRAPQGWNASITNGGNSNYETHANGSFDGGVFKGVFKGKANAGNITVPILGSVGSNNLIGNPYPSPISTTEFIAANSGKTDGTFYFWVHKTRISSTPDPSGLYRYNNQDYAVYNKTGGVATSPVAKKPDGNIAAGQGFFVKSIGTGNVVFKNSMRVQGISNNSNFYRTANRNETETVQDSKYWLSLSTPEGLYSEFLVGYMDGATNSMDINFDGITYSSSSVMLYTVVDANKLAIQGRQFPFSNTDVVPVGYKAGTAGEYTISINKKEGLFEEGQEIYLYDTTTNQYHDLLAGDFTFTSAAGTFESRFEVRYINTTLGVETPIASNSDIVVYKNGNQIAVKATNFTIEDLQVYDITGKLLYNKKGIDNNEFSTSSLNVATQVLVVKVTLDGGQTISKKVIMN